MKVHHVRIQTSQEQAILHQAGKRQLKSELEYERKVWLDNIKFFG